MAAEETTPRRPPFLAILLNYLSYLILFAVCIAMLIVAWPLVRANLSGQPLAAPPVAPTAIIAPRAPSAPISQPAPIVAPPIPGIAQNAATAQAEYDAAVRAAEQQAAPVPNTGQSVPVVINEKPAGARQPSGDNVPTAEPIQPAESNDQFGSKPVLVNPQETHTCLHAQVWVDGKGCKNPTPVGAP